MSIIFTLPALDMVSVCDLWKSIVPWVWMVSAVDGRDRTSEIHWNGPQTVTALESRLVSKTAIIIQSGVSI